MSGWALKTDDEIAVVAFSGGQDSTTVLFLALQRCRKVVCVTADYGQRHSREIEAAGDVIRYARQRYADKTIEHEVINLRGTLHGTSPLVSETPLETYSSAEQMEQVIGNRTEVTFVPMRNALFMMVAANRAAEHRAATIYTGICQADNANYHDCREPFRASAERTIRESLGITDIRIDAPLLNVSKAKSIGWAALVPGCYKGLSYSHTAYSGEYPPSTADHATVLRAAGFAEAKLPDPLLVRAYDEGLLSDKPPHMNGCKNLDDVISHYRIAA